MACYGFGLFLRKLHFQGNWFDTYSHSFAGKRIAVVTHESVIRSLHQHADVDSPCGTILNALVSVFHLYKDKWVIKTWRDVSHLN